MPKALKGRLPRHCADHRTATAKALRRLYDDLVGSFPVSDGLGRREALLTASAWLRWEQLSVDLDRLRTRKTGRGTALAIRRLERAQARALAGYRGGLERLRELTEPAPGMDLARRLTARAPHGAA